MTAHEILIWSIWIFILFNQSFERKTFPGEFPEDSDSLNDNIPQSFDSGSTTTSWQIVYETTFDKSQDAFRSILQFLVIAKHLKTLDRIINVEIPNVITTYSVNKQT